MIRTDGLVRRARDTVDRRRVIIEATEEVARRAAPIYGPLVKESEQVLGVFDAGQLEVIIEFVRKERGLLTRHTARVHDLLDTRHSTATRPHVDG